MSRLLAVFAAALVACTSESAPPEPSPSPTLSPTPSPSPTPTPPANPRHTLSTAAAHLTITAPGPETFLVRFAPSADTPVVPSFSVDPRTQPYGASLTVEDGESRVVIRIPGATLRIDKNPLHLALLDPQGQVIVEEAAPVSLTRSSSAAAVAWNLSSTAHVYGLGDKTWGLDRRGHTFRLWNTDAYAWQVMTDPLYKSIPFVVVVDRGRAHGFFFDQPSKGDLDIAWTSETQLQYKAQRAPTLDLYLFAGPEPKKIVESYTQLTGRTPLPPRWALGYHQSRYSYESDAEAREVVARLQTERIPVDALWLDIDFQANHAAFTVNVDQFPDLAKLIGDVAATGVKTVVIADPHLEKLGSYRPYAELKATDSFIKAANGEDYVGKVWPGDCVFPDFSLSRVRTQWGGLFQDYVQKGAAGFWNDMNEPSVFNNDKTMPDTNRHRLDDGRVLDHVALHNVYGHLNVQGTYEGILALRPGVRPFVLTRAAFAGTQKWAASWTGDNLATWEHLAITIPQLTNLGVSGMAFVGADVTGYKGAAYSAENPACPDPELITAWMEQGALTPLFRNHSEKRSCRREPWVYAQPYLDRMRAGVERRYRLLPYLYTAFEETSRTGVPVMRPLWLEFPGDVSTATSARAFLVGADLLVAPRLTAAIQDYTIVLPAADWFDVRTGAKLVGGGPTRVTANASDSVALFARAGAIIPQQPVTPTAGRLPSGALTLDVWPGAPCRGAQYLDDGESFAFRTGASRRITYSCAPSASTLQVTATSEGTHPTWWSETQLRLHDVPRAPTSVRTKAGEALMSTYDAATRTAVVTVPGGASDLELTASW